MMGMRLRLLDAFEGKRDILIVLGFSIVVLLALEILIFIASSSSSGERSTVEVKDKSGNVIYHTPGDSKNQIDRWYIEKKYGNLDNYDIDIQTVNKPFPFRAWVSASVGVPVALILLISYLVKVYVVLLHGDEDKTNTQYPVPYTKVHPFVAWSMFLSSSSIFLIGFLVALSAMIFWMVPNLVGEFLQLSMSALVQSKWVVVGTLIFVASFAIWVVYLRYRLSKRMMDHQFNLERYRLEQQGHLQGELLPKVQDGADRSIESRSNTQNP